MADNIYGKRTNYVEPLHYDPNRGQDFRWGHCFNSVKSPLEVFPVPNLLLLNFKIKRNEETSGVR